VADLRVPEPLAVRVPAEVMRATMAALFGALGLPEVDAARSADVLLYADLRGIDSHGVSNMTPVYVSGLQQGWINPKPLLRTLRDSPAAALLDGDRGLGLATGPQAMQLAMDKAAACGMGSVVVTNSRHFGAAAYHAQLALERDMIGVAMTLGGLHVVPTFGAAARLGLNPIAIAAPAGREAPFVFDASMSSVAGNKLAIARRLGAHIGPGWIATPQGVPIMEPGPVPDEFLILPLGATREIGSHKGYGLAAAVDVLSGILGGNPPGFRRSPGDVSHHFLAYRIDAFTEAAGFRAQMDEFLRGLRETPPAPGCERVLYAGLPEQETERERRVRGIPYHRDVIAYLRRTAAELGASSALPA
jgi:LDH2 family malate/lactate/ureidoglycolate dehydrogenase